MIKLVLRLPIEPLQSRPLLPRPAGPALLAPRKVQPVVQEEQYAVL